MKKFAIIILVSLIVSITLTMPAAAEDVALKGVTVESASTLIDKNGVEYVRFIIGEKRTLSGIAYTSTIPMNAFGSLATPEAKAIKSGDKVSAICRSKTYEGSRYLTVISWIK